MALIVALGSNLGDRCGQLAEARTRLAGHFIPVAASRIYHSLAVDYTAQPDFYNQVLQFELPDQSPVEVLQTLLAIERSMGRERVVSRGPRCIDLDILFWGLDAVSLPGLEIPHPRWSARSFVVKPLSELPFFQTIKKCFTIPGSFEIDAVPLDPH